MLHVNHAQKTHTEQTLPLPECNFVNALNLPLDKNTAFSGEYKAYSILTSLEKNNESQVILSILLHKNIFLTCNLALTLSFD